MNLHLSRCRQAAAVMRAGKGAVQKLDAIEVGGIGYAVYLAGHSLELGMNHKALGGIIGAGGCLLGKLLHANQLLVDNAQGAVRRLDQGYGVIDISGALVQGSHIRPHKLADGQTGGIIRRGIYSQAR